MTLHRHGGKDWESDSACAWCECDRLRSRLAEAESLFDADIVEIIYGPPCAEYEAECACCRAWRWVEQAK